MVITWWRYSNIHLHCSTNWSIQLKRLLEYVVFRLHKKKAQTWTELCEIQNFVHKFLHVTPSEDSPHLSSHRRCWPLVFSYFRFQSILTIHFRVSGTVSSSGSRSLLSHWLPGFRILNSSGLTLYSKHSESICSLVVWICRAARDCRFLVEPVRINVYRTHSQSCPFVFFFLMHFTQGAADTNLCGYMSLGL